MFQIFFFRNQTIVEIIDPTEQVRQTERSIATRKKWRNLKVFFPQKKSYKHQNQVQPRLRVRGFNNPIHPQQHSHIAKPKKKLTTPLLHAHFLARAKQNWHNPRTHKSHDKQSIIQSSKTNFNAKHDEATKDEVTTKKNEQHNVSRG